MNTHFHQRSLDFFREEVVAKDSRDLDTCAKRLGIDFPASFREWYALRQLTQLLECGGGDHLYKPSSYELRESKGAPVVVFMGENQTVYRWGVSLDGSTDPPVVVKLYDAPPTRWLHCTDTFSTFIYTVVFDTQHLVAPGSDYGRTWIGEQFPQLSADDLAFLLREFQEEPSTYGLPAPLTCRCSGGWNQRIVINNYDEPNELHSEGFQQSDWVVVADCEQGFADLKSRPKPRWQFPDN